MNKTPALKEMPNKAASGMQHKAPEAQRPGHIKQIGEGANTALCCDAPAQQFFQRFLKSAILASLLYLPTAQSLEPQPQSAASGMLRSGRESAQFCRHCHGEAGVSLLPDIPNLAGQNAAYLLNQMNKFAAGKRKNAFMEELIRSLKPEERANIALYFSQQSVTPQPTRNSAQVERGSRLYARLCAHCHGPHAYGSDIIPRLAGQQTVYLQLSLKRYRSGSGERIDPRMQSYTRNLKDNDIDDLSAYLTSLR